MDIAPLHYVFAAIATFIGETLGAIFGGGSFVIQPALLALGVDPHRAVANDVTSSAFSGLFFVLSSLRKQKIDRRIAGWMAPAMACGAVAGGLILSHIPEYISGWIILIICCLGFVYTLSNLNKSAIHIEQSGRRFPYWRILAVIVGVCLGMYDGVSGAGSGILIITALTLMFRDNMKSTLVLANMLGMVSLAMAGITFWGLGLLDARLMLAMIPASCLAGIGASKIVGAVSEKTLRIAYICIVGGLIAYIGFEKISATV